MAANNKNNYVAINRPAGVPDTSALINEYQKAIVAVAHGGDEIRIAPQQSLYEALEKKGLLVL